MEKNLSVLKKNYLDAVRKSNVYLESNKKRKFHKEFLKVMDLCNRISNFGKEGIDILSEIAKGEDYSIAVVTSMMLFHIDREKSIYHLKRIIKKNVGGPSFYAADILSKLLEEESGFSGMKKRVSL